ncbi:MAG: TRAP transporter fused permease subunit [Micropepsaceae bacterium]
MTAPVVEDTRDSEGGPTRFPAGLPGKVAFAACIALAAYALYWTQFSVNTAIYRASFLGAVLTLLFVLAPARAPARGALIEHGLAAVVALGLLAFVAIQGEFANRSAVALGIVGVAASGFVLTPLAAAWRPLGRWRPEAWIFAALAIAATVYLSTEIEHYKTRPTRPTPDEVALGAVLMLLVLEATRRAVGWILPFIAILFLLYAWFGAAMPEPFDHRGFSLNRIVGQNFLTLEGIFSTPLDVAATFIVLFTIYGAVLERGGAGRFFIDWAFALFGRKASPAAPGRAVVASGFLLGTVSGSGVATTVTVGSIAWPMLRRAGYPPAVAGGLFSAAGIGATLSPPTLGAAAFIIAEYLKIDYLEVLIYAAIPTLLYYFSCWLMTEADARRLGITAVAASGQSAWSLARSQGYHFLSLAAIAVALIAGLTSFMAVFWSIAVAFALSMLRADSRLVTRPAFLAGLGVAGLALALGQSGLAADWGLGGYLDARVSVAVFWGLAAATLVSALSRPAPDDEPRAHLRMVDALGHGARSVLGIAATCATAGIIVSVVNLTGLGLTLSGVIVALGGGERLAVVLLAAVAMWVLGAAVPVTASYIIAAVMLAPALTSVGVPEAAAHMFLFYYAVLADVSPPTALAPFSASAITGGPPFRTMMQAWKYTLPAFLVPVMFCLTPLGFGLLGLNGDGALAGDWSDAPLILLGALLAGLSLAGLTFALTGQGWSAAGPLPRLAALAGGLALVWMGQPIVAAAGGVTIVAVLGLNLAAARRADRASATA